MEKYSEYKNFIVNEMNNPIIKQFGIIFSYYNKINKRIHPIEYNLEKININSKMIHDFYYTFDKKYNFNLETKNYDYDYSLNKVYELSIELFVNMDVAPHKAIIINSVRSVMILFFQDYLLKRNKKFKTVIEKSRNKRRNLIFSRINLVKKKLKLISLYQNDVENLEKYIETCGLEVKDLLISLDSDYEYLSTHMITDFLYSDKRKVKKIIHLLNNNKINNLKSLNLFFNHNQKSKNIKDFCSIGLCLCLFSFIVICMNPKASNNDDLCSTKLYTEEVAKVCIERLFVNDALSMNSKKQYLDEIKSKTRLLSNEEINKKLSLAYKQYNDMNLFKEYLKTFFIDKNLEIVKDNITIKERYELYHMLITLPQKDFIDKYLKYIDIIDKSIYGKDVIELTNIPFISQKDEKIYNGCEAASLLMALKYRGKLLDYNLADFIKYVPIHESDPYQGFIYSIYDFYPLDVAHWIAPSALAKFGSNYYKTTDISGSEVSDLKKYIDENKPVIVYVTAEFENPIITSQEVPLNLHVVLLTGYNKENGEYIVLDPYVGKLSVEKEKFENSYNHLKYAVVVE